MLLDTSGFYALLDTSSAEHALARERYNTAIARFTHSYVLVELVPLAQTRRVPRRRALAFISAILKSTEIEVVWCNRDVHVAAHKLLLARLDKEYSLCDAISFVLMRERGERDALTTDHHFEQEGLTRLLS